MSSTTAQRTIEVLHDLFATNGSREYWYQIMALNSQQMYSRNTCAAIASSITDQPPITWQPMVWLKIW